MPGERRRRAATAHEVELRHARVRPGARSSIHDAVERSPAKTAFSVRVDHPLPGEDRRGCERRDDDGAGNDPPEPARKPRDARDDREHGEGEQLPGGERPRPASASWSRAHNALGTTSTPDVARDVAGREGSPGATSARPIPTRGRDEWPREPVREPDDEHDQPERREIEDVAVVEAVEAELRARERGRDEEHPAVHSRNTAERPRPARTRRGSGPTAARGRSEQPRSGRPRGRARGPRGGTRPTSRCRAGRSRGRAPRTRPTESSGEDPSQRAGRRARGRRAPRMPREGQTRRRARVRAAGRGRSPRRRGGPGGRRRRARRTGRGSHMRARSRRSRPAGELS